MSRFVDFKNMKHRLQIIAILIVCVILVMVLAGDKLRFLHKTGKAVATEFPKTEELHQIVRDVLHRYDIVEKPSPIEGVEYTRWDIELPGDLPVPSIHLLLQEAIRCLDAVVLSGSSEPLSGRVLLRIGWQDSCVLALNLIPLKHVRREEGRIALIIDDFGDYWNGFTRSFLDLGADLTFSIIPGRRHSTRLAREMTGNGFEILLHLPMEPVRASFPKNDYTILSHMGREAVRGVIQRSLDEVPGIRGVNNHMGSKVSSERETISHVLNELKSRNLYFVDSRTIATTVAFDVARELGIPAGRRDVFIDTESGHEVIRGRLWELARKAKENGFALGIGHCRRNTLEVLQQEIGKIQEKGYRFVPVSTVVR